VKKKKIIRAKIVSPCFRGPYRTNIVKASSLKIHVKSPGFKPGRDGFIAALVDGKPFVYTVSDEVVVGNLSMGQHSITVQCVDTEKNPISRSKTDTILFTVSSQTIFMEILRPKSGELFNGGTVPLNLNISGEVKRKNCLAVVTVYAKVKDTKVFPLTHSVIDLKNLPSGIHTVTITLLDLNFAPIFDHMGKQMVQSTSFGYFIDKKEEQKRSDENIMKQLLFLDLIGGKISREEMPTFIQNYINSNAQSITKETDGTVIGIRMSYGKAKAEIKMLDSPNSAQESKASEEIKCKISFSNGGKKLILMPGDTSIESLVNFLVRKHSLKNIVIMDEEGFELDFSSMIMDYSKDGTAYFNVKSDSN